MTIQETREYFPFLKSGKIYFNHASVGPLSTHVISRINNYLYERSAGDLQNYDTFLKTEKKAKERLAGLLNAETQNISWTDNVSNAFNVLVNGLNWEQGDHILLNDIEFPANVYPFLALESSGVKVDFVKSGGGKISFEDIERKITPKTRLISISLVQFISGFRINLEALSQLCEANNILLSVDAIQGAGAVDIDLKKYKIDFLAGGAQKWLMALQGLSYFYVSDKLMKILKPKYIGWLSVESAWDFLNYDLRLKKNAEKFQSGTLNALGITALNASLEFFEMFGRNLIEELVLKNSRYFIGRLIEAGFNPVLAEVPDENLSGIVTVDNPFNLRIYEALKSMDIIGEIRGGYLRFSPHFYNTKDEIDQIVSALISIKKRGIT